LKVVPELLCAIYTISFGLDGLVKVIVQKIRSY